MDINQSNERRTYFDLLLKEDASREYFIMYTRNVIDNRTYFVQFWGHQ